MGWCRPPAGKNPVRSQGPLTPQPPPFPPRQNLVLCPRKRLLFHRENFQKVRPPLLPAAPPLDPPLDPARVPPAIANRNQKPQSSLLRGEFHRLFPQRRREKMPKIFSAKSAMFSSLVEKWIFLHRKLEGSRLSTLPWKPDLGSHGASGCNDMTPPRPLQSTSLATVDED